MEMSKSGGRYCSWCGWHVVGVVAIAFGSTLLIFFPDFFLNQLLMNLELTTESRAYSEWKAPTVPLYMDIYLFNWTNPHELKNKSTKPTFTQLGPYRFREQPDKLNISFDEHNVTVTYRKFSTYFFDPEGSNGSLSDVMTTVNMVAIGAGSTAQGWNFFMQKGVSLALSSYKEELHVTKTVRELLFDGYSDDLMKMSTLFSNETPYESVGFLIEKNGTDKMSGDYTVSTGVGGIENLGKISSFNNLTEFPFYEGECKKLKGSAGEFFSPNPSKGETVHLFAPEMCRSIPYDYEKDIELHGMQGYRFSAGVRATDNGTLYEENKCYATSELMPSGVMNVSICNYGQPMFMSFPHFYGADSSYTEAVNGLTPNKSIHQSYFTLEPTTGITLEVTARFQTNVLIKQYGDYITLFQNVPRIFMPLFWVEQRFVLDADKGAELSLALKAPLIGQSIGVALLIVGVILMSHRYLRKVLCSTNQRSVKLRPSIEKMEAGAVIKEFEMNPLMTVKQFEVSRS